MKKELLFLSVTEFFSVYTKLCLQDIATCRHLSLRYPNEEFTEIDHDLKQIENMVFEDFQLRGLAPVHMPFYFDAHLGVRIERHLNMYQPAMIFVEIGTLSEIEFKLLSLLQRLNNEIPIAVILPEEEKTTNQIYKLLNHGVKEVISHYDQEILRNAYHRHVSPSS